MGLVDSIIGAESGGNPNAQNPNSSASGLGQFIDSTWVDTIKAARPDLAAGKSDAELIALKSDPDLSRQMTEAYAAQNGQILSKAGFEANLGNTYLAHFAGPQGAVKVLSADPNAPVSSILGDAAVRANPFLKGMTAADLQAWASRKMGAAPQQPVTQTAQASPTSPAIGQPVRQAQASQQAPTTDQMAALQAPRPTPSLMGQLPAEQIGQPPPIFFAPRKPIDLSHLQAALQASGNRGFFLNRG